MSTLEIIAFLCVWWVIYKIFYSPKARIRILLRQIYRIPIKMERKKRDYPEMADRLSEICEESLVIRYNMIDSLLNYYFDPEEDGWYIKEIRDKIPFKYQTKIAEVSGN
ncbi:hypothetical protein D4R51_04485 [bacterium]|nr:MAG: hypothetical protein D4R51_04485 [bacterium]